MTAYKMKFVFLFLLVFVTFTLRAQNTKSYNSFGELELEDNSFLLEEAFNQQMGVIQHISTASLEGLKSRSMQFSFTQEIPLTHKMDQLSYTLVYNTAPMPTGASGFGDLVVSYRRLLLDEDDWMMVIPRISVIVPTGNSSQSLGAGGWGFQFNMAATKRLSRKLITHYNLGFTEFIKSDYYEMVDGKSTLQFQRNLFNKNIGASAVWHVTRKLNPLIEWITNFDKEIANNGNCVRVNTTLLNPGIRVALNVNNMQIVPGVSAPMVLDGKINSPGILFYLSIEPEY